MSALGIVSLIMQIVGGALVLVGLYRRDPVAQRWLRARVDQLRRLFRRERPHHADLSGLMEGKSEVGLETSKRRSALKPGASTEERLGWLEDAVAGIFEEIDQEGNARRNHDRKLARLLAAIEQRQTGDRLELERLIEEAGIPERWEWWGAALLVAGLIGSAIDGIVS